MTMQDIRTSHSIVIQAPADEVWHALTTPASIKQWFFGVDTESDWEEGSALIHRGEWQGKPYEDTGVIERIEPPRLLVHTHFSATSGLPDEPGNHQRVTWSLADRAGGTELTVSEENLPSEEAKEISDQAWTTVLQNLERTLEHGDG
jgi:uncharacterized protein YndB with AHSA1/START domain